MNRFCTPGATGRNWTAVVVCSFWQWRFAPVDYVVYSISFWYGSYIEVIHQVTNF
jgi:hypothetical protein